MSCWESSRISVSCMTEGSASFTASSAGQSASRASFTLARELSWPWHDMPVLSPGSHQSVSSVWVSVLQLLLHSVPPLLGGGGGIFCLAGSAWSSGSRSSHPPTSRASAILPVPSAARRGASPRVRVSPPRMRPPVRSPQRSLSCPTCVAALPSSPCWTSGCCHQHWNAAV